MTEALQLSLIPEKETMAIREGTLGLKIFHARREKRMTQRDLAKRIGLDYTYLSKIENNRTLTPPSWETLQKIAKELDLDEQDLLYLSGRITENNSEILLDFIRKNYQKMPEFFRFLRESPDKIIAVIDESSNSTD